MKSGPIETNDTTRSVMRQPGRLTFPRACTRWVMSCRPAARASRMCHPKLARPRHHTKAIGKNRMQECSPPSCRTTRRTVDHD